MQRRPPRRSRLVSIGGLGATYLASQLPGYFGSVATCSGFVQHQRLEVGLALQAIAGVRYGGLFGRARGDVGASP